MYRNHDADEGVNEKLPLVHDPQARTSSAAHKTSWSPLWIVAIIMVCLRGIVFYVVITDWDPRSLWRGPSLDPCAQVDELYPIRVSPALTEMEAYLGSSTFQNESVLRLSGAVQIRSESFDDMGSVEEDERWHVFFDVSKYLEQQFPLVNRTLRLERINTHGLLYTWEGTDTTLKPTVLMAHQDVVPVERTTQDQWTHGAFSGHYDGKYIWGRGSSDCKNTLIGIMEAVESLIRAGFEPRRTLVLSFGFDEEISGRRGAGQLAEHLIARYAKTGGAAVIVDEGASFYSQWGATFAIPGVGEKGYIDVEVVVRAPGGHSSIPPAHTGIGIASELISLVESQPYAPHLDPSNPVLGLMQCAASYGVDFPHKLKKLLPRHGTLPPKKSDRLAKEASKLGPAVKYLFTTSQAVDLIEGGVKINALPERTRVLINHRVNIGETTAEVRKKLTEIASTIAHRHNLTLHAFTNDTESPSSITVSGLPHPLEPAPVTPTTLNALAPYRVLSGTTRALYGKEMIVAPGLMTGNTDTKFYWALSEHIFRFNPGWDPDSEDSMKYIHTVNERISIVNHVKTVQWFSLFVRNMDEAVLE